MNNFLLKRLQNWYKNNCNGDWEHFSGIKIATLDNPGWTKKIKLEDTALEGKNFSYKIDVNEHDWMFIDVKDNIFDGAGDADKLESIVSIFLDEFMMKNIDPDYLYELYAIMPNLSIPAWRKVNARMLNEDLFEIVDIPEFDYKEIQIESIDILDGISIINENTEISLKAGNKVKCELRSMYNYPVQTIIEVIKI